MLVLIDENLPISLGTEFRTLGFAVEYIRENPLLRGKSDEVIFDYAVEQGAILVTRDLGFADPGRFPLAKIPGIVFIRFPNEISTSALCREVARLIRDLREEDFRGILVITPGAVRKRKI